MGTNTFHFHRVLRATPEVVYKAFLDADALAKWLPPNGFVGTVHAIDAHVGGSYRMTFRHLASGESHTFGGTYLELVPGERIRYNDRFDDPNLPGEMHATITLKRVSCGCDIAIVQEGVPDAIPAEMCHLGWQDSLRLLALLVEGAPGA
ncbi:MAG TPA: SRPBCC family protein [Rudaea sp.]|nr:SRPBCC family protein [Rudaea sp.]